jgi:hypothetical protein
MKHSQELFCKFPKKCFSFSLIMCRWVGGESCGEWMMGETLGIDEDWVTFRRVV